MVYTSQAEFKKKQPSNNSTSPINKLSRSEGAVTANETGGGRLSALRNWLKTTKWRRKDKQTPPHSPPDDSGLNSILFFCFTKSKHLIFNLFQAKSKISKLKKPVSDFTINEKSLTISKLNKGSTESSNSYYVGELGPTNLSKTYKTSPSRRGVYDRGISSYGEPMQESPGKFSYYHSRSQDFSSYESSKQADVPIEAAEVLNRFKSSSNDRIHEVPATSQYEQFADENAAAGEQTPIKVFTFQPQKRNFEYQTGGTLSYGRAKPNEFNMNLNDISP